MREGARQGFGVGLILMYVCTSVSANIIVYSETNQIEAEYRDMPARFGAMVNPEGIQAMLVYAEPADGCSRLPKPPTPVINESIHWAILISRNNCTFYEKVKNAQDAEYHIAIVHNVGSDELEPMSENEKQGEPISIIAVFVGERAGQHLRDRYLYNNSYFIEVNNDYPFIIDNLLLPFAIVVGLCFFLMLGFMVVKCIRDRKRARRLRLPYSSLKQIPSSKFHKGDPYETCAICLEDYVEGDKLRILPCSHAYHTKCIDPWLTRKRRVCPVCKRKVFAANEVPPHPSSLSDSEDTDSDDTTPLIRSQQPAAGLNWGTFATTNQQVNPLMTSVALDISTASSSSTSSPQSSSSSSNNTNERDRVEEETGVRRFRRNILSDRVNLEEDDRRARRLRAAKCDELSSSQPDVEREREEGREREEASASGQRRQHGHNIQGTSISLPINASLEDHQEVPSTVIAGVSGQGEDDQQPNTSAIKKLWQSWSR